MGQETDVIEHYGRDNCSSPSADCGAILSEPFDNGLWRLVGMFPDVEPVENIDEFLYGPISEEAWPSSTRRSGSPKQ